MKTISCKSKLHKHITYVFLALIVLPFAKIRANSPTHPTPWHAQWIWQEDDGPKDTWMCFRKTIHINSVSKTAIARISAESKYWLWINGQMVVFEGQLQRDRFNETWYDEIDLAPYLVKGKNILAAQVWYYGKEGFSHHDSGKGGFLFEANVDGQIVLSDNSWKMKVHPAYEHSVSGGQVNIRIPASNVRFNAAQNSIENWQTPNYNDATWSNATVKDVPPTSPWKSLAKRPFPQWKNFGLKNYENEDKLPKYGNGEVVEAILPYNARISAYLKVKAPAGKLINMQTDQYDGWYDFGEGPSTRAEYITKEGIQEFESFIWMSGNTVKYTIPKGVEIVSLKFRELGYPSEFTGAFSCNDPFYTKLWDMARRTLYINMYDNFMDCPDRERALWWGDVVNQSGECFYTLDTTSHALIRKSMKTLVAWQRKDSTLFSPPSTIFDAELPQQMLASIGWYGFWNYFMNTNDSATIREVYPAVKKYLFIWKMKPDGTVMHRRGAWDWGDWGTNIDIAVLDNAWYYLALKAAIPMAEISGFNQDTVEYHKRMESIENNFDAAFWKEDEQHFRSAPLTIPDDRANAMVVLAGLAKPEQFKGIQKVLQDQEFASPYMEKYVLEALCKIGADTLALTRMKKRYTMMVNSPYNTLWEVWSGLKEGTINHGWNAPNTVLSQNIAGLSPIEPGWSTFQVLPMLGGLDNVSQRVSTVKGEITLSHSLSSDRYEMQLESPEKTLGLVGVPKIQNIKTISINGKTILKNGKSKLKVSGCTQAGENAQFLFYKLTEGKWRIKATFVKP